MAAKRHSGEQSLNPAVPLATLTTLLQHTPLSQSVKELIDHCLPQLLDMYDTEDNKWVSVHIVLSAPSCDEKNSYNSAHFEALWLMRRMRCLSEFLLPFLLARFHCGILTYSLLRYI